MAFTDDVSGNGRNLTMTGTVTQVPAPVGSLLFGAGYGPFSTSNYLSRADAALNLAGTAAWSGALTRIGATFDTLFAYGERDSTSEPYLLRVNSDSTVSWLQNGTTPTIFTSTQTVGGGEHTFTVLRDNTAKTVVVKIDGIVFISASYTGNPTAADVADEILRIGVRQRTGVGLEDPNDGYLNELRIWGATSTPSQATLDSIVASGKPYYPAEGTELALYRFEHGETLLDSSGNGRNLTMTGTVPWVKDVGQFKKFGKGIGPFTTSNFLSRTDSVFALNANAAATLKFYYDGASSAQEELFSLETTTGYEYLGFWIDTNAKLNYHHDNGVSQESVASSLSITEGYHTMTVRRIGTNVSVYIDKVQYFNYTTTSAIAPSGSGGLLTVGINLQDGTSNYFLPFTSGNIYELRIWGATNTPSQATLDTIVSLTDYTYLKRPEGNEIAMYTFESSVDSNAGAESSLPWMVDIDVFGTPKTNVGTILVSVTSTDIYRGQIYQNTTTGSITWDVLLSAGTWSFELMGTRNTDEGTVTVSLDGATVGSVNKNGSLLANVLYSITGINVKKTKVYELKIAGSGTFNRYNAIRMMRTA